LRRANSTRGLPGVTMRGMDGGQWVSKGFEDPCGLGGDTGLDREFKLAFEVRGRAQV